MTCLSRGGDEWTKQRAVARWSYGVAAVKDRDAGLSFRYGFWNPAPIPSSPFPDSPAFRQCIMAYNVRRGWRGTRGWDGCQAAGD